MSEHSYKKVQKSYQSQSKFGSSSRQGGDMHFIQRQDHQIRRTFPSDEAEIHLQYENNIQQTIHYPSRTSFEDLTTMNTILLDLIDEFRMGNKRVVIDGDKKDHYQKRLLLLESELNGLMKQRIMFEAPDREGGTRKLDYTVLLNEKQNQIVQLQKKIHNLEERLRRRDQRELELENELTFIYNKIKAKNQIIELKERQISEESAYSSKLGETLSKVKASVGANHEISKLILQSVPSLDKNQIKMISSKVSSSMRGTDYFSSQTTKLARGLENLSLKGGSMEELQGFIQGWILGLPEQSFLRKKIVYGETQLKNEERIQVMDEKFKLAHQIYRRQIDNLQRKNPHIEISHESDILQTLRDHSSRVSVGSGGLIEVEKNIVKTVEVPVQDARTKNLIYQLATEMKKIYTKYPKLYGEINPKLAEFFSQELIDVISVDEIDRVVSVVKYEPQVVRVQNIYAYSSQKSRKVEFHLRVLLKALLTEMDKMVTKTGFVPEIDEGVIGLIKEQIMDVVDIDDILKVYRTVPKIVEVEKIVEKVVEKIVEVPKLVSTQTRIQVPYEVKKYQVVENVKNVPVLVPQVETVYVQKLVEAPQIIQKIVEVPKIVEKIVQVVREVPKIQYVDRVVEKIVEVEKINEVTKEIVVRQPQYHEIIVEKEKIVPVQRVVEVPKQVKIFVEKIQQVVKEIPKVVEVERIREVIVEKPIYYEAPHIKNQIITKYEPVDRIVEKIVPIVKVEDRIIEVPKIVQKIVELRDVIREPPIPVQVIIQKPVRHEVIKQVQIYVEKPVLERVEVEKIVQRVIEKPIVKEIIRVQQQIIKEPVIERIQSIIHKEVQVEKPVVLYQERVIEVDKIINHFIKEPEVITIHEERVIPLETVVKEPIAVPTIVEKIIEKLVEVPKVVQVEKIVEKIVPVPRVVEKVIEVEKIVQKIVNKPIIQQEIKEIERRVEIPVIQEKVLEIEAPRNIYIENQVPKEIERQILVNNQIIREIPRVQQIQHPPRVVVERREIPVDRVIEKIVPFAVPETNATIIKQQIVVPVEIQIPVDIEKQKIVPVEHIRQEIVQVERERQKIVTVTVQPDPMVYEVERFEQKLLIEKEPHIVKDQIPYFQTELKEIRVVEEKVVPIETVVEKLVTNVQTCDRLVDRVIRQPQIYEVEKLNDRVVRIPEIVEVEKVVPHIINVNSYIESIVEKVVEIPLLIEKLKTIERLEEKVIPVHTNHTEIKEVERKIQKAVIEERIKEAVKQIHVTEKILQVVKEREVRDADPIIITQDKVMEVPFVVEKIVQKIVVMPQIVQVLKYVHEVTEQADLGVAVSADLGKQQLQYKALAGNVRTQLNKLLVRLKHLWTINPELKVQIQIIQRFLAEFEKLILYPKIHEVIREKVVEKPVQRKTVVTVPTGSSEHDYRMELSKAILIEKLLIELKRIKEENPRIQLNLDQDIKLIFGSELGVGSNMVGGDLGRMILDYSNSVQNKFKSMGGWTIDHQMMLNSFLEERFLMANILKTANADLAKTKAISEKRLQTMRKYKQEKQQMERAYKMLEGFLPSVMNESLKVGNRDSAKKIQQWMSLSSSVFRMSTTARGGQPTRQLDRLDDLRMGSILREKQEEIVRLKQEIRELMMQSKRSVQGQDHQRLVQSEFRVKDMERKIFSYEKSEREYTEKIYSLERDIERLRKIEQLYKNSEEEMKKLVIQINDLKRKYEDLKKSRTTGSPKRQSERHQSQSSSSSSYGVNYMDYANIDDTANRGIGTIEGSTQVYRSTYSYGTGGKQPQTITQSRGQPTQYQTSYRHEYSSGDGYRTFEFSKGESSNRSSGIRQSYESEFQGEERGGGFYQTKDSSRRTFDNLRRER